MWGREAQKEGDIYIYIYNYDQFALLQDRNQQHCKAITLQLKNILNLKSIKRANMHRWKYNLST